MLRSLAALLLLLLLAVPVVALLHAGVGAVSPRQPAGVALAAAAVGGGEQRQQRQQQQQQQRGQPSLVGSSRASQLRQMQKSRVKRGGGGGSSALLAAKPRKKRKRRGGDINRTSGYYLRNMNMQDKSFYLGVIGHHNLGRQVSNILEVELKKRMQLKIGLRYAQPDLRVVDFGSMPLDELADSRTRRKGFAMLRKCQLLVHVVGCSPAAARFSRSAEEPLEGEVEADGRDDAKEEEEEEGLGGTERLGENAEWSAVESIRNQRAEMAYADLCIVEERKGLQNTKSFWSDRAKAFNEMGTCKRLEKQLTRIYEKGGLLKPAGPEFSASILADNAEKGIFMSRKRDSIRHLGFTLCKRVVYCATTVPLEGEADRERQEKCLRDVMALKAEYGVPVAPVSLGDGEGREELARDVIASLPKWVKRRDPAYRKKVRAKARAMARKKWIQVDMSAADGGANNQEEEH
jgi:hypothetical protein